MKQNKFFLGLATIAAALTFASCSSEEPETNPKPQKVEENTISFTSTISKTRATEDPQAGSKLSTSSQLAIWAMNGTTALENGNNEQYTVDSDGKLTPQTAANTMKWPSEATLDFYAYAPYNSAYAYNSDNAFAVQTDQTTTANYLASDLVLAQKKGQTDASTAVLLQFDHMMTKVIVNITKETGATVDLKNAMVSIVNTNTATTFNPSAAAASILGASSTPADITLFEGAGSTEPSTVVGIMVPQTIAAGTRLIKVQTNPGDAENRTLYAKLSEETQFKSGQVYTLGITIGDITTPVSEVDIELGSASLVVWSDNEGNNTIGVTTDEETVYEVGDYVLTDGTFVKASALTAAQKPSVAGIIFSTTVSATDEAAGYNAYVMGINRQKMAFHTSADYPSQMVTDNNINDLADAIADLDGRTRTTTMLASSYYGSLTDNTTSMLNLDWYTTTKGKAISANASAWYLPSFGQLVQILNNLGGANFTTFAFGESGFTSSSTYTVGDADALTTMTGKIQAYVTAAGGQGDMFTSGNINYPSSTENGSSSASHYGKVFSINFTSSAGWNFGKALGRTDSQNYSVIPVAAVKF